MKNEIKIREQNYLDIRFVRGEHFDKEIYINVMKRDLKDKKIEDDKKKDD